MDLWVYSCKICHGKFGRESFSGQVPDLCLCLCLCLCWGGVSFCNVMGLRCPDCSLQE